MYSHASLTPAHNVGNSSSLGNVSTKDFGNHQIYINTFHQHPEKYSKIEKECHHSRCCARTLNIENYDSMKKKSIILLNLNIAQYPFRFNSH
jgi:hypothetical protein